MTLLSDPQQDIRKALEWALDVLEISLARLDELEGDTYDAEHFRLREAGLKKARKALANAERGEGSAVADVKAALYMVELKSEMSEVFSETDKAIVRGTIEAICTSLGLPVPGAERGQQTAEAIAKAEGGSDET